MGIFKPFHFIPQAGHFLGTVFLQLFQTRLLIHQLAFFENGHLQFSDSEICQRPLLPGCFRIKDSMGQRLGHNFFMHTDFIRNGLARFLIVETVHLFEAGVGDLGGVFGNFDFWNDGPVFLFYCYQFVHAAEYRAALAGDKPFAYTERINLRPLLQQIPDQVFIQRIGNHDLCLGQSRFIQHDTGFFC